ncbi:NitT/TauT family transport system permease protein [Burkholderia sp. WP9]|uniref:ABC transporter permease n=1 Tax=Burkholderia sp. WP9 TaxID=1500263 RepID=UPI00089AA111|nr:ABC transporter permease subunit [Burkholderia sp. WP9]SEC32206.1 NitT/TauT family transport system permease protein [Burkholderia sp. WP9]
MSTQFDSIATRGPDIDAESGDARGLTNRRALPRGVLIAWLAALAWLASAALTQWWPSLDDWPYTKTFIALKLVLAAFAAATALAGWRAPSGRKAATSTRIGAWLAAMPWLLALALGVSAWEAVTAQLEWLPRPFFAPPQALIGVYAEDYPRLGTSVVHSFGLLAYGYLLGAVAGFTIGVSIGWSQAVSYWVHPVLRLIGPLPATAWLPLAFFFFPSSFSASVFLIALATAFPVAVLTWSGVAGVNSAYYDIARTLGARPAFLILRVAIPAALPSVFVGLFMGLGASFSVLIVAEMMGVKAGLGWYLQWAQGWAAYSNMYAALLVMALMCSGLITLLFRVRDRLLAWQKGLLKW